MQEPLPGFSLPYEYHDFREKLEMVNVDPDRLEIFYKAHFPDTERIEKITDLVLQRQGIDTILILKNGKKIHFDEKVRFKDYGDILLEEYSIFERQIPGWLSGDKKTDYIAYIVKPTKKVYFLPFLLLRKAWLSHYAEWLEKYGRKFAKNKTYTTSNIAIPREILFQAIYKAMGKKE